MKKEISIIEGINDKDSLTNDAIVIENRNIRKIEIDGDYIIITVKLPKGLYTVK